MGKQLTRQIKNIHCLFYVSDETSPTKATEDKRFLWETNMAVESRGGPRGWWM